MKPSLWKAALVAAAVLVPAALRAATINGTVVGPDSTTAIAGATVILSQPGTGGGGRAPVDTAQTDAQGKFSFTGLAAAQNYGISAAATGYVTYFNNNVDLGTDSASADLAIILATVPPPADISGKVRNGVDTAAAIAGATVVLSRPGTTGGGVRVPVDTATTDAQGAFSFPDLAAAENYGLSVTATGFSTYANNNIDLRGRDTSVSINLFGSADISGTVVGADSTTVVANATVVLTQTGTGGGFARAPVDTATTDAQGKFSFPDLVSRENYGITVTATGFSTYTNNNIDLRGRDTAVKVVLELPPPPGTITGVVRGPGGATAAPIANATVVLNRPGTGGAPRTPMDTTQTDAQGAFTFANVPAGDNYGVSVTATGYNVANNNNVDLDGGDTATVNFNLAVVSILPGALQARGFAAAWSATGLALTLPPASAPRTLSVFALSGSLRHREHIPAGIAQVLLPARALQGKALFLELKGSGVRDYLPLPGR